MKVGVIAKIACALIAIYLAFCVVMFFAQKSLLFHPTVETPPPEAFGLADFERVSLKTRDGVSLVGWLHRASKPDKAIVYFCGNADSLPPYVAFFRRFAEAGYSVLGVNYRGYGGSEGAPSEAGLYLDGEAALRFMADRVPIERITVMGRSMGSGVAVKLAAENPIGSLVLISPYTSISNLAARDFWYLPTGLLLTHRFPSIDRIARVRAPLLILHGARDTLIPPAEGQALFAAANEPKRIEIIPDADHIAMDLDRIAEQSIAFDRAHGR